MNVIKTATEINYGSHALGTCTYLTVRKSAKRDWIQLALSQEPLTDDPRHAKLPIPFNRKEIELMIGGLQEIVAQMRKEGR